jgi:hypothetical protein
LRLVALSVGTEVLSAGTVVAIVASFVSALLTEPLQVSRRTAFVRRSRSPVDEETLQQKLKSESTHVINGSNRREAHSSGLARRA